jgi:carboxyl-terminal processing protease
MTTRNKKIYLIALAIFLLAGGFLAGTYVGYRNRPEVEKIRNILNLEPKVATSADLEPFWKAWNLLKAKSYTSKSISDQDKVWGAIKGLAASYKDPYTEFFSPQENKLFEESINGQFGGVGMEVGIKDNTVTVITPLKDTPAYRGGIKTGDKILKIDDRTTGDMSLDEAISLIRGEKGTKVKLTIYREGDKEPREITLTREIISIPTLDAELLPENIFLIKLYNFSANSPELFRGAMEQFSKAETSKLILDLRSNPGGFLEAAVDMGSWFIPLGKIVAIEDFADPGKEEMHRSKGYKLNKKDLRMIVLVNGGSASASEILAGALRDHGIAKIVGDKTFGKGSVQELIPVTKDTSIKITIAKWLTPNKVSISDKGIEPDYPVKVPPSEINGDNDKQLDKAIELLKQ